MDLEDHDLNLRYLWENQSWSFPNSDNTGEIREKLELKPQIQKEQGNGGEVLANKKRNDRVRREKNVAPDGEGKNGHEVHIWTERERRKKMRNMFGTLHALLPQLPSKAEKSTIIDEAVSYIKSLQGTLEKLEKQKQERLQSYVFNSQWKQPYYSREGFIPDMGSSNRLSMVVGTSSNPSSSSYSTSLQPVGFQTWSYKNIVLNIVGFEAQFSISAAKKESIMTTIAFVLDKYKIEIMSANIVCNGNTNMYLIVAQAQLGSYLFQDSKSVAEIYKQAAGEIQLFIA